MLEHEVAAHFFSAVREQAREAGLMSSDHFSVDGSLLQAWGSVKNFRPKDEHGGNDNNGWGDFKGQQRKNDTHESKTNPDAKLWRKGKGKDAKLSYGANALMENRNGLIVDFPIDKMTGTLGTDVALEMIAEHVDVGATWAPIRDTTTILSVADLEAGFAGSNAHNSRASSWLRPTICCEWRG